MCMLCVVGLCPQRRRRKQPARTLDGRYGANGGGSRDGRSAATARHRAAAAAGD